MLTKPWARACAMVKALTKSRQITSSCYGKIPNKGRAKGYFLWDYSKVFSDTCITRVRTVIQVMMASLYFFI